MSDMEIYLELSPRAGFLDGNAKQSGNDRQGHDHNQ